MRNARQMPYLMSSRRRTILMTLNRHHLQITLHHRPIPLGNRFQKQRSPGLTPYLLGRTWRTSPHDREPTGAHQAMQYPTSWKQSRTRLYQRCRCRMKTPEKETRIKAAVTILTNLLKRKMTWETTTLGISMTASNNLAMRLRKLLRPATSRLSNLPPLPLS